MKRFSGLLIISVLVVALMAAGCATTSTRSPATAFTGEVWTWDEQVNTVTLRQASGDVRVQVTPDQLIGLRLHETKTIYGVLAAPSELPLVMVEGSTTLVPRGAPDETEVIGTVASVDPAGRVTVGTPQGAVQVWRATDGSMLNPGARARVRMRVQPLDVVVQPGYTAPEAAADLAASPRTEPGHYAIITGRILAVDPTGGLIVDSPRGPVSVRVANVARYRINDTVQIRTSIHPMP